MPASSQIAVGIDTRVNSSDRLGFTLFLAIIVHAMLIFGVSFSLPDPDKMAPTLNVTLATHRAERAPDKAKFLAQQNQQASGTENKDRELTSDNQAAFAAPDARKVSPAPQVQAASPKQHTQKQVITTRGPAQRHSLRRPNHDAATQQQKRDGMPDAQPAVTQEIASLQAKLDRQRQEYAKRPRIRRLTSVATRSSADAEYLNNWSRKIEQIGNKNYPQKALQQRLTGRLRMAVTLNPNGTIRKLELSSSSGVPLLDQAALQIVRLASPFAPFPPAIRKTTDRLVIIRTWSFEIDGLSTSSTL